MYYLFVPSPHSSESESEEEGEGGGEEGGSDGEEEEEGEEEEVNSDAGGSTFWDQQPELQLPLLPFLPPKPTLWWCP